MNSITINGYGLSIDGLAITYTEDRTTTTLIFDPVATCNLLLELNAIEGFDHDRNGEPVILFVSSYCGVPRTGFALWYLFAKHFPLNKRQAEIIVEHLESKKHLESANEIINNLLNPLKTA